MSIDHSSGRPGTAWSAAIGAGSDALVLTLLGHGDAAVYDGSLVKWMSDPDMPIETDLESTIR